MRDQIIKTAKRAIERGFGSYYALPQTTWNDVLAGYESGKRLSDEWESKIMAKALMVELANNGQ